MPLAHYSGIFLLFWLAYLFVTGLTFFSRGFLLRRVVIPSNSSCQQTFNGLDSMLHGFTHITGNANLNNCWIPPRFNKSIIILIDGLRYDFVKYHDHNMTPKKPYENKLTVVHKLLQSSPRSALMKFVADPPTTTMQRIKGLVTGSLPTFIDAGRNFASFEIEEDNIIDQLIANRKKAVFLGDDTWTNLLPNRFFRAFPFDSFDVKDLHTVDRGIRRHLVPQIRSGDWDLLIAHFLGVDHCGHRYGPSHEMMGEKLTEMNSVLESVIENMDDETILFVMGDHGMTRTGDHGGDSDDEIEAALFIHSKSKNLYSEMIPNEIRQVDFPPTFALLLGLPVPFGNLGKIVTELFVAEALNEQTNRLGDAYYGAMASYVNMKQVEAYLNAYLTVSTELSKSDSRFTKLNGWREEIENLTVQISNLPSSSTNLEFVLQRIIILSTLYVKTVLEMCHQVWAQFDYVAMLTGITVTIFAASVTFYQIVSRKQITSGVSCLLFVFGVIGCLIYTSSSFFGFTHLQDYEVSLGTVVFLASVVIYAYGVRVSQQIGRATGFSSRVDYLTAIIFTSLLLIRFSNSYVVSEDSIVCFFVVTLMGREVLSNRPQEKKKQPFDGIKKKWKLEALSRKRVLVLLTLFAMSCLILSTRLFWKCREEQWWCESSLFVQPVSSIPREFVNYRNWRLFVSVFCVMSVCYSSRWLLRKAGNLNGFSLPVLCFLYSPFLIGICISLYWVLQTFSPAVANNIFPYQQILLPNAVFLVASVNLLVYLCHPLFILNSAEAEMNEIGPFINKDQTEVVHQVYRHLKANWKKHLLSTTASSSHSTGDSSTAKKPLIVYGLATMFSAPLIAVSIIVMLVLILLSRDGLAPAFFLLLVSTAFGLHSIVNVYDKNEVIGVENSWILAWSLLSAVGFYATGHQTAFPALHWESGLVGTDGTFSSNFFPAVKVLLNTFSSSALFGVSLPILMLWPITNRILYEKQHLTSDAEFELKRGEFLFYGSSRFYNGIFDLSAKYMWLQGVKMLSSMLAVALHRRHLMVWKIFAPKFLFESLDYLITVIFVLFGYFVMLRVYSAVDRWMKTMELKRATKPN